MRGQEGVHAAHPRDAVSGPVLGRPRAREAARRNRELCSARRDKTRHDTTRIRCRLVHCCSLLLIGSTKQIWLAHVCRRKRKTTTTYLSRLYKKLQERKNLKIPQYVLTSGVHHSLTGDTRADTTLGKFIRYNFGIKREPRHCGHAMWPQVP
jgi:hypothetical protein